MPKTLKRVYRHYEECEEFRWGMWRIISGVEKAKLAPIVRDLILDLSAFRYSMYSALVRWPISCEVNLSHRGSNRAAWLWHAGACIVTHAPEDVTRSIWPTLTDQHRQDADRIAWEVVAEWEAEYLQGGIRFRPYEAHLHLPTTGLSYSDQTPHEVLQET